MGFEKWVQMLIISLNDSARRSASHTRLR